MKHATLILVLVALAVGCGDAAEPEPDPPPKCRAVPFQYSPCVLDKCGPTPDDWEVVCPKYYDEEHPNP